MTFKGSPMKRAKLRGLKRNAAVVPGRAAMRDDVGFLECVRDEEDDQFVRPRDGPAVGGAD